MSDKNGKTYSLWRAHLSDVHTLSSHAYTNLSPTIHSTHERFSGALRRLIKKAYGGKLPSAARVTRDYNLLSGQTDNISQETMRKWMNGAAIPRADRLLILAQWLGPELQTALLNPKNMHASNPQA
jgi:hypothetical protein